MPIALNQFLGAETGGIEEWTSSANGAVATDYVRSGAYSYKLQAQSPAQTYSLNAFDLVASGGSSAYTLGFGLYCTSVPAVDYNFVDFLDSTGVVMCRLTAAPSGVLKLFDSNFAQVCATATSTIVADTWQYVEIHFEPTATGTGYIRVNGITKANGPGDFIVTNAFNSIMFNPSSATGGYTLGRIDDIYLLSGSNITALYNDCQVLGFRSTLNSATPDSGSALNTGTWLGVQAIPFDATTASYTGTPLSGSVNTDDAPYAGPSGAGLGTIKGYKGIWRAYRGGGGGSTHNGILGNSGGSTASYALTLTTSAANYLKMANSFIPTNDQFCRIGFGVSGAQDFILHDMLAQIIHVPLNGKALVWNPNQMINNFLVR